MRQTWEAGIERELDWWRHYLGGGGLGRPEEFRFRFHPNAPLQPHIARVLPREDPVDRLEILDCAAGPATMLGKTLDGHRLRIEAVDALADHYRGLLDELGLEPPVPSVRCEVEQLDGAFEADRFSLVYMRFALDHCYDPLQALAQMVRVARPGGVVMVEHYRDEGEVEFQGLRQWALEPEAGDLTIWNRETRFRVGAQFPEVRVRVDATPDWLTMLLYKSTDGGQPQPL